ncbi:ABC transporter [Purpureocillium lavendulum]|uniref:ABC transporter n=1 Tax=Purpureocillium lavendulum TaxID=1247861 RepID=A0AB34G6C5_9HYPO|nr:ABC transporter [Purpureocillium lavendulum]
MSSIRPLASPALRGVLLCPSKRLLSTTAANRVAATPPRQPIYEGGDFVGDGGEQLPGKTPKSSNNLKNSPGLLAAAAAGLGLGAYWMFKAKRPEAAQEATTKTENAKAK